MIRFLAVRHPFAEFLGTLAARFEARRIVFMSLLAGQDLVAASRRGFARSRD